MATTFEGYFFYPEDENLIWNLISNIQNINIQIALSKRVNKGSVDLFNNQLLAISETLLANVLGLAEVEHLKEDIDELSCKLKSIEIV